MANGTLTPPWFLYFTDSTGNPLSGGKIYTYVTGTSTPVTVYQNAALTTPFTNPIILPADGKVTIYQTSDIIKAVVYDSNDVLQDTFDPIMSSGTFIVEGPPNIVFTDADGVTHTTASLVNCTLSAVPTTSCAESILVQMQVTPTASLAAKQVLAVYSVVRVPSSNTQTLGPVFSGVFFSTVDSASGSTVSVNGAHNAGQYTGEGTCASVRGTLANANVSSSAVVTTTQATRSTVNISGTSSGTTVVGVDTAVTSTSSGTFTNVYGVRVEALTNSGTWTNTYGVYVGDVTSGTQTNQAYSFYASDASARNFFAGDTTVGGLATVSGFGTHTISAGGTGGNIVALANTTSGTGNYALYEIGSGTNTGNGLFAASQGYTPASGLLASGIMLYAARVGGISINAAEATAGDVRIYSRGTLAATFGASQAATFVGAFGCNGATAQTAATVGSALAAYTTGGFGLNSDANMQALYNTVVAMRAALVANGIAVA